MFAVVQLGSSQFKVSEGDVVKANRMDSEEGDAITLDKVLMFVDGSDIRVGQPYLKDVKITATVVKHSLATRVLAFKFRKRKRSITQRGHRQRLTALNITKISA